MSFELNDNPFKIANSKLNSADIIAEPQLMTPKQISQKSKRRSNSADMIYLSRYDSLQSVDILRDIRYAFLCLKFFKFRHKSSTDLPIFLHYETLDVEKDGDYFWDALNKISNILRDGSSMGHNQKEIHELSTPKFSLNDYNKPFSADHL